jgi:hypothetical protein
MTIAMIVLILLVRRLGQPWRGVIDAGIVLGLGWGFVSILARALKTLCARLS